MMPLTAPLRWAFGASRPLLVAVAVAVAVAIAALSAAPVASAQARDRNQVPRSPTHAPVARDNYKPTSATGAPVRTSPLAPAAVPAKLFARPRIGLALGGGGALGLTEIGALAWFEEHHIPVDVIAGTSMGCMISALYSSGQSPDDLMHVMNDQVFQSVFSFSNAYTSRSFRRREDSRELPNGFTLGVKHKLSLRNALLTDQGLNAFLERQFLRFDDQTDFNHMPIPLRCIATDLNSAQAATFARGSLPDAVRASVSIPGVFAPFELNGHAFVDGGVVENLPTPTVHAMGADVVLAFSLPIAPIASGDTDSLFGVLGRSAAVAINVSEVQLRKQADVVMIPNIDGLGINDYLKAPEMARRGYAAAEAHKAELERYRVSAADWAAYLAHRRALLPGVPGPVLRVRVDAPTESARTQIDKLFAPMVNQPVNTARIEGLLDQIRADGRYDVSYAVGYESEEVFQEQTRGQGQSHGSLPVPADAVPVAPVTSGASTVRAAAQPAKQAAVADDRNMTPAAAQQPENVVAKPGAPGLLNTKAVTPESLADVAERPVVLVTVKSKHTGPPFLTVGANLDAQTAGITRATVEAILVDQDLGGYGAELRSHVTLGYLTGLSTEYYRPLLLTPRGDFFVAPRADLLRQPFPIFNNAQGAGVRLATRQFQKLAAGGDIGLSNEHTQELRAGFDYQNIRWTTQIGADSLPDLSGSAERARVRYVYDTADRALIPQFGLHLTTEFAYLFHAVASPDSPEWTGDATYSHRFAFNHANLQPDPNRPRRKGGELLVLSGEGGTYFGRNVAPPFQFSVGGPLRLSASTLDQYRGNGYLLVQPALLRRIAQLPAPLGQSIYVGGSYEYGRIYGAASPALVRQDVFFGLTAETPLGVITLGPSLGTNHERKFVFTVGKLF